MKAWQFWLFLIVGGFAVVAFFGFVDVPSAPPELGTRLAEVVSVPTPTPASTPTPVMVNGLCLDPNTGAYTSSACLGYYGSKP